VGFAGTKVCKQFVGQLWWSSKFRSLEWKRFCWRLEKKGFGLKRGFGVEGLRRLTRVCCRLLLLLQLFGGAAV
jgi:hypothetical protein